MSWYTDYTDTNVMALLKATKMEELDESALLGLMEDKFDMI